MNIPHPILGILCVFISSFGLLKADADPAQGSTNQTPNTLAFNEFEELLKAPRSVGATALSPDGKYIAHHANTERNAQILVFETANPAESKLAVDFLGNEGMESNKTITSIRWLYWLSPTELVALPTTETDNADKHHCLIVYNITDKTVRPLLQISRLKTIVGWTDANERSRDLPRDGEFPPHKRSAKVFSDFVLDASVSPDDPNIILLVIGKSAANAAYYSYHIRTDELKELSYQTGDAYTSVLPTRQGDAKLAIKASRNGRYEYEFIKNFATESQSDFARDMLPRFAFSPENHFGERMIPVGFDTNPDILYYASNIGADTYSLYAHNIKTNTKVDRLQISASPYDIIDIPSTGVPPIQYAPLIFNRFDGKLAGIRHPATLETTTWVIPQLATAQTKLANLMPGTNLCIREWSQDMRRILFTASSPATPIGYYCLDVQTGSILDINNIRNQFPTPQTVSFTYDTSNNLTLTGVLILPAKSPATERPTIVMCPTVPWVGTNPKYSPLVHAYHQMGYPVLQVNTRGTTNLGTKARNSIKSSYDTGEISDILSAIDHLSGKKLIDGTNIILTGAYHGGFVALRGMQLHPDRFRAAIVINPVIDPAQMAKTSPNMALALVPLGIGYQNPLSALPYKNGYAVLMENFIGNKESLKNTAVLKHSDKIKKPILAIVASHERGTRNYRDTASVINELKKNAVAAQFVELELPQNLAQMLGQIETFLTTQTKQ